MDKSDSGLATYSWDDLYPLREQEHTYCVYSGLELRRYKGKWIYLCTMQFAADLA